MRASLSAPDASSLSGNAWATGMKPIFYFVTRLVQLPFAPIAMPLHCLHALRIARRLYLLQTAWRVWMSPISALATRLLRLPNSQPSTFSSTISSLRRSNQRPPEGFSTSYRHSTRTQGPTLPWSRRQSLSPLLSIPMIHPDVTSSPVRD